MAKEINLFEQDLFQALDTLKKNEAYSSVKSEEENYTRSRAHVKRVIEALLFATNEPISFQRIREITEPIYPFKPRVIQEIIRELELEYHAQQRAFKLEEIAGGYVLRTKKEYGSYVDQLFRSKRGEKLSQAASEVLAIIAYRQPITKPHIDAIRGVDSTGTVQNLLERELIEPIGKLEAPGRPTLYQVTVNFLIYYGLKDLKDLPKISDQIPKKPLPIQHGPLKNPEAGSQ